MPPEPRLPLPGDGRPEEDPDARVAERLRGLLTLPSPSPAFDARLLDLARERAAAAAAGPTADAADAAPTAPAGGGGRLLRFPFGSRAVLRGAAAVLLLVAAGAVVHLGAPQTAGLAGLDAPAAGLGPHAAARVLTAVGLRGEHARPKEVDAVVAPGEPLVVASSGYALLALADGTRLALDGGARATIDLEPGARRVRLDEGRLYADVVPVGSTPEDRPIVVETASGRAHVLGTELVVQASRAATRLSVRHGLVRLENARGTADVGASEVGLLTPARRPSSRRVGAVDRHFRWIGKLEPGTRHPTEKPFGGGAATADEAAIGSLLARLPDGRRAPLRLVDQRFDAALIDGVAHVTVRFAFRNDRPEDLEGTFRFALPKAASITRYAVSVDGELREARVVEREAARRYYEQSKRELRDPALLEWSRGSAFTAKVFPIEAGRTKRIEVSYAEELPERGGVSRLVLPLVSAASELLPPERLTVTCRLVGPEARAAFRSPSHYVRAGWDGAVKVVRLEAAGLRPRNDFVLELARPDLPLVEARLQAAETPGRPAAFALKVRPDLSWVGDDADPGPVVFLCDASASQRGTLEEVQLELLEAMADALPGGARPRAFAAALDLAELDDGGPDPTEALLTALWRHEPAGALDLSACFADLARRLPADAGATVVYLGDGLPTAGLRRPEALAASFATHLPPATVRRFVAVGVGPDVDAALLGRLARDRAGVYVGVRPGDDLGRKVDEAVSALTEPVLTQVQVDLALPGVERVAPTAPRNLRAGEVLSLSGLLHGDARRGRVELSGLLGGRPYRLAVPFTLHPAAPGSELAALWARRRVGDLLERGPAGRSEALDLALDHGVVTPYTSLLVLSPEEFRRYRIEEAERQEGRRARALARQARDQLARGDLAGARAAVRALAAEAPGSDGLAALEAALRERERPAAPPDTGLADHHAAGVRSDGPADFPGDRIRTGSEPVVVGGTFAFERPALSRARDQLEAGDLVGALADYDQALQVDPDAAAALAGRALVRYRLGDVEGAKADSERLAANEGAAPEDVLVLRRAHEATRRDERAELVERYRDRLSEIAELEPRQREAQQALREAARTEADRGEEELRNALEALEREAAAGSTATRGAALETPPEEPVTRDAPTPEVVEFPPRAHWDEARRRTAGLEPEPELAKKRRGRRDAPEDLESRGPSGARPGDDDLDDRGMTRVDPPDLQGPELGLDLAEGGGAGAGGGVLSVEDEEAGSRRGRASDPRAADAQDATPSTNVYGFAGATEKEAAAPDPAGAAPPKARPASGPAAADGRYDGAWARGGAALADRRDAERPAEAEDGTAELAPVVWSDLAPAYGDAGRWKAAEVEPAEAPSGYRGFTTRDRASGRDDRRGHGSSARPESKNADDEASGTGVHFYGTSMLGPRGPNGAVYPKNANGTVDTVSSVGEPTSGESTPPAATKAPGAALGARLLGVARELADLAPADRPGVFGRLRPLALRLEDPAAAAAVARELLRYAPDDLDLHQLAGDAEAARGRPEAALVAYSGLVEARPDDPEARLRYGLALERLGRPEGALAELREAVRLAPEAARYGLELAKLALRLGRPALAERALVAAVPAAPGSADGAAADAARLLQWLRRAQAAARR